MTKILLVEDDKSLREIYGVRLLAEGYDIVSAGDGEEALAMAIKEKPSLIVSDVMMPKISGFDMLDILRSTTETKDIKVIMMTALSSDDQRKRGEQLGADRYLVKSQVGIEDVVRTVHDVLGDMPSAAQAPNFNTPSRPQAAPAPAPVSTPPAPQPQPVTQPAPVTPIAPAATSTPSGLPQPTAPFSTTRPANLGDRIIHPIERPETEGPNIADRISNELNAILTPPAPMAPPVSIPVTSEPAPVAPPVPQPQPIAPTPAMPVAPAPEPSVESSGLDFEETPRPAPMTPPQAPSAQV